MSTHPFDTSPFAHTKLKHVPQYLQAEASHYEDQCEKYWSNYGKIASQVDAAIAEMDRRDDLRSKERWVSDEGGWYSPNGFMDSDWEYELGFPLPEDPEWHDWKAQRRVEANWRMDDTGWYAPDGRHESEFEAENLPEDQMEEIPEGFGL